MSHQPPPNPIVTSADFNDMFHELEFPYPKPNAVVGDTVSHLPQKASPGTELGTSKDWFAEDALLPEELTFEGIMSEYSSTDASELDHDALDPHKGESHIPEAIWTAEEIKTLEEALKKFPEEEFSPIARYAKISSLLPGKTIRDVGQRVKLLRDHEGEKRKGESFATQPLKRPRGLGLSSGTTPLPPTSGDALENRINSILEENLVLVNTIRENLVLDKMDTNGDLMLKFASNVQLMDRIMKQMPGQMSKMPPLPVKLNTIFLPPLLSKVSPPIGNTSPTSASTTTFTSSSSSPSFAVPSHPVVPSSAAAAAANAVAAAAALPKKH